MTITIHTPVEGSVTSWDVEQALKKLVTMYDEALRQEWLDHAGTVWLDLGRKDKDAHMTRATLEIVRANRARWSGGASVKNMCEQLQAEVALEWADTFVFRLSDECLNDAADRAQAKRDAKNDA